MYHSFPVNKNCSRLCGSVLGPPLFLIYVSELINDLSSSAKLFADDTSLFSVVFNVDVSVKELTI